MDSNQTSNNNAQKGEQSPLSAAAGAMGRMTVQVEGQEPVLKKQKTIVESDVEMAFTDEELLAPVVEAEQRARAAIGGPGGPSAPASVLEVIRQHVGRAVSSRVVNDATKRKERAERKVDQQEAEAMLGENMAGLAAAQDERRGKKRLFTLIDLDDEEPMPVRKVKQEEKAEPFVEEEAVESDGEREEEAVESDGEREEGDGALALPSDEESASVGDAIAAAQEALHRAVPHNFKPKAGVVELEIVNPSKEGLRRAEGTAKKSIAKVQSQLVKVDLELECLQQAIETATEAATAAESYADLYRAESADQAAERQAKKDFEKKQRILKAQKALDKAKGIG